MPELPEVEVLVRHLDPVLQGCRITGVEVRRPKVLAPTSPARLRRLLVGARFESVSRRGKYLVFALTGGGGGTGGFRMLGHLGMTGRMYVVGAKVALPRHAAVVLQLGRRRLVYEDPRYFGRLTLDLGALERLGPEPGSAEFTAGYLTRALERTRQAVKVKLLDQRMVAGVGNIYASEALFRARIDPRRRGSALLAEECGRLQQAIRTVLKEAVSWGSTVPLDWSGRRGDRLFYYGAGEGAGSAREERMAVYGRAGEPCRSCGAAIRRVEQAGRSTYFCPGCQR